MVRINKISKNAGLKCELCECLALLGLPPSGPGPWDDPQLRLWWCWQRGLLGCRMYVGDGDGLSLTDGLGSKSLPGKVL